MSETAIEAPGELFDSGQEAPIAFRCDRTTRNQAKRLIADQWDVPYAQVRIRKTEVCWDQEYVDELIANDAEEPYDGWPGWRECGPGESGVPYWTSGHWEEPELYDGSGA